MKTIAATCLMLILAASPAAAQVSPFPRQFIPVPKVCQWTFEAGAAGWTAANQCTVTAKDGDLWILSTGSDPYVVGPAFRADGPVAVTLRARCGTGDQNEISLTTGEIFWTTIEKPNFSAGDSVRFDLIQDGRWHDYTVLIEARGPVTRLRLDPGSAPGLIEISSIGVTGDPRHPLEIERVGQAGAEVRADVRNHSEKPIEFACGGRNYAVEGGNAVRVTLRAPAAAPFEAVPITVEPKGLPAISRTVFTFNPEAPGSFISRKAGNLSLAAAIDGSGAFINMDKTSVAVIAPLVHRSGAIPPLKHEEGPGAVRFRGDGITVALDLAADELKVTIQSNKPVEGPVVRALGDLKGGLFAGLEYLGKGEQSSSDLDIETAERFRYAPDPLKVTMPLMACATDRGTTAVLWSDMGLQPVFATPNFFDGSPDHRMALRGTRIEATVLVRRGATIEDAVLWAVGKRGLPPVPPAPRSREAQMKLCLDALTGPLKGDGGWGHCAEPTWARQPFADHASTLWRLTGQAPDLPKLVPGGAHVRSDAIYFVTGRASEWLRVRGGQVRSILAAQKPDGSWRYDGKYRRGHYEDTASGYCAHNAAILLNHAWATGDAAAREGGLKALQYMRRFDVPRGAQTWELSLHTPDILASAYLVWSYVRGYQLTGKAEHLAEARRWAAAGLPFVYQRSDRPVMAYATIAVYGATNWRAPNWMGLPVQWCGGVYAYALALLAPHDKTADWAQVARGILISAEQQQAPDGPYAGCLPDSFNLAAQRRQGPFINPCALVSLRLALEGEADSLAVAADARHRVAAPFPVAIEGASAVIRARRGQAYQVLIDGTRIVDVKSEGTDSVPLE
jgi:hypothetical protein